MLRYAFYGEKKKILEDNDNYQTLVQSKIVDILGVYDYDEFDLEIAYTESDFTFAGTPKRHRKGIYPGEQYFGVTVKTEALSITAVISTERDCSEYWGSILSEDDLTPFIGAKLLRVYLTNTCCKTEYIDYILNKRDHKNHDFCDIQFINFETDRGVFQLTVYNTHNGYYGHDIFIQVDDKIVFQKVLDNTKNSCIERSTPDENTIPKVLENNAKK